ncbi:SDR family NAD(P)-dependent oxidoreductase [Lentzea tibetensis]|uniref:SDR family NAD(P)-dependent oxidoreductase n=1 Tax=Lentzea tibetensis TaxID=2591470 RepID=UPI001F21AF5F|nr:SDR family NAD(P)-dependent oxidoreductase [Lentzea tibetensis]
MVVTGAAQGLGRAFAEHAAREGAAVVVNDVEGELAEAVAAGIRGFGGRASASVRSVAAPEQAAAVIEDCLAAFGKVDGLVNNPGLRHESPLADEDPARLKELIEVNVLGTFHCAINAAKVMRPGSSMVNLGSVSMVGQPGVTAYSASKGAVASMTVGWAVELKSRGIRVNAICPVAVTRMGPGGDPPEKSHRS